MASAVARYWAAKELTRIERTDDRVTLRAPFACPAFTVRIPAAALGVPRFIAGEGPPVSYAEVRRLLDLKSGTWHRDGAQVAVCFDLPKGKSALDFA